MELLNLRLEATDEAHFTIIARSRAGQATAKSKLPFFESSVKWRITLIKSLEAVEFRLGDFGQEEQDWMVQSGILAENRNSFQADYLKRIGQALYESLFPVGEVRELLQRSLVSAETGETQLHVQLEFSADVAKVNRLQDYPWELIHNGQRFLAHHRVTFSRYIAYLAAPPKLSPVDRINVLLISSPASDEENKLPPLSQTEQKAVLKGLKKAQEEGHIQLDEFQPVTFQQLRDYLTERLGDRAPHVLHFDGHGFFGKRCNQEGCRTIHGKLRAEQCKKCGAALPTPQGYLVFLNDGEDEADYVSAEELGSLLQSTSFGDSRDRRGGVRLAVLSACKSATALGGDSVFNGVAQNLIGHEVPAAVAMQYSVSVKSAGAFAEQFYRSLGQKQSLATTVSQGRAAMGVEGNQWYRLVLYLRWQDNEGGQLFAAPTEVVTAARRLGIFQAPPLPEYFVQRPEASEELKQRLLKKSSNARTLVISAIHGLGSIGKSTLAAALAGDAAVQKRFCDGILWATLGQEPDVLSLLSGWVQALGDYDFRPTSIEATSAHLRTLLYDKAVLLVADDAWTSEHALPFKVGGAGCQVLVTTRDGCIAYALGASTYPLDVMKPEQAMQLLTNKLGRPLQEAEQQLAEALAKAVGYLPLALELAAAQVADGISWAVLLEDLAKEVARLKTFDRSGAKEANDEASRKRLSLTTSLNLSVQRLSAEDRQNFIWLGVFPEDASITRRVTATLWEMDDDRDAEDTLRDLRSKALLLPGVPLADGTPTYRLHDLFHDLARNLLTAPQKPRRQGDLVGLGLTLAEAHASFIEQYRKKTRNNLWHTLPQDGYIQERLVWHLEKGDRIGEIHQLLREEGESGGNGWYEVRERLGQTGGYLTDISRAWELAEEKWTEATLPEVVGWQCRYALIAASLNSLAKNIPTALLVALVRKKLWTPEQGLTYALQIPDPQQKVTAIAELTALEDGLSQALKEQALQTALAAAKAIQNEFERARALSALADKLPENLLPDALAAAQAIQNERDRALALSALAERLPEVLPEALAAAKAIRNARYRADALSALADKLPEVLPEALSAAKAIENEFYSTSALSGLAKRLPENLLPEVLAAAKAIQNERYRASALGVLAERLPEVLPEALAAAKAIEHEFYRALALSVLAEKLPEMLLLDAFAAAKAIEHEYSRAEALSPLADKLPENLLPDALSAARAIADAYSRARALSALAEKLPQVLPEALAAAKAIENAEYRADALRVLADKLPEVLPDALSATKAIENAEYRADALSALAEKLPEVLPEALSAARAIADEPYCALALSALAEKLPEVLPEALSAARAIEKAEYRASALSALAEKLPEVLPEALSAARAIADEYSRARALSALADKLPEVLPEALSAAKAIRNARYRADALSALADKLPEVLPEALSAAKAIKNESYLANAIKALVPRLSHMLVAQRFPLWREVLHKISRRTRSDLLRDIKTLVPVIFELGGEVAGKELAGAIQDVGRWWR